MTTQQYREVKRKAAVGERIKIVAASYTMGRYDNGDEFTVNHVDRDDDVYVSIDGKDRLICLSEFVVLEPIAQPITPSPLGTSFLSSDPLYAAFRQFVTDNAAEIRAILPQLEAPDFAVDNTGSVKATVVSVSKPLTRAQVIAKATADVAELLRAFWSMDVDFHVNRDKRAVTALVKRGGALFAKFTAKCSPADVFHAEIGKAISLRKALGLMVPSEYTDAPQPDPSAHVHTGTFVELSGNKRYALQTEWECGIAQNWDFVKILDDTDVDYGAVPAKGAAA